MAGWIGHGGRGNSRSFSLSCGLVVATAVGMVKSSGGRLGKVLKRLLQEPLPGVFLCHPAWALHGNALQIGNTNGVGISRGFHGTSAKDCQGRDLVLLNTKHNKKPSIKLPLHTFTKQRTSKLLSQKRFLSLIKHHQACQF